MRILFFLIAVAIAAYTGFNVYPFSPHTALLTGTVAYLILEVFSLRRRIVRLEQRPTEAPEKQQAPPARERSEQWQKMEESFHPAQPLPTVPHIPRKPSAKPTRTKQPHPLAVTLAPILTFITRGNPVLKTGLVVLFFGVGFLLKYAAQQNLLPIEIRLAGVALGGMALLVIGWRLRRKHPLYGLGLEGGGIGILYLVVFAASKFYPLLPLTMALAIMIGLVGFSGLLAVLQESKGLAVSGAIGGFLAPVLMSTGGGNHVLLFSYYALLGSGILGIAWFKAWRELNLVGLFFTFGLFSLWASKSYTAELFASTEPFLLLFFLMYCLIAVLFALRQPLKLRGFIDGPQVFGLPIMVSSLQAFLVHDFRYGMACSALGLGGWYIVLARVLWNRMGEGMRLLTEAFLALGVVFASLAIPLGLDPHWTTASWALEGAAMIWIGVRQDRVGARIFGLLLQTGAALAFLENSSLPMESLPFANRAYLSCALIGIAALFASYWCDRLEQKARPWERALPLLLLGWGLIWWYTGGMVDIERHRHLLRPEPIFLLYTCLTSAILAFLCRKYAWPRLGLALLLQLPMMGLVYAGQLLDGGILLDHVGWLAWPLAFCLQYGVLKQYEHLWPPRIAKPMHCLSLWLFLLALTTEITSRVDTLPGLMAAWPAAACGLVPTLLLYLLEFKGKHITWPVARYPEIYHGIATDIPVLALMLWMIGSFELNGAPTPLPYIPILNPLELIELAILLLALLRELRGRIVWPTRGRVALFGLLAFACLNVITARTVHHYTKTWYSPGALFDSPIFQAAIAALWALSALSLTVYGARKQQRKTWLAGAVLLGLVVCKLFAIDLSGSGSIGRIISFLVVGLLMLVIGYFAPLPPKPSSETPHAVQ